MDAVEESAMTVNADAVTVLEGLSVSVVVTVLVSVDVVENIVRVSTAIGDVSALNRVVEVGMGGVDAAVAVTSG